MFSNTYNDKRVLVTGHTGFKGSWLISWLLKLGAEVIGVSHDIPTQPAMFDELGLASRIKHIEADVCNLELMRQVILNEQPDFIFHLAAQSIVSTSYSNPVETIATNVMGTTCILEVMREVEWPCSIVLVTSDKCYNNMEWIWGYRETDGLGGKDIYSGSKAAAEMIIKSYLYSFFSGGYPVNLAIGRAGNVIGGGDWAQDRIVADWMRAWSEGRTVDIRSPKSTRPWQHVLEPLSGYLILGQMLVQKQFHGEAFNFGPKSEQNRTVVELLHDLYQNCGFDNSDAAYRIIDNIPFQEASFLSLNFYKTLFHF